MLLEQLKRIYFVMDKPTLELTTANMRQHMSKLRGVQLRDREINGRIKNDENYQELEARQLALMEAKATENEDQEAKKALKKVYSLRNAQVGNSRDFNTSTVAQAKSNLDNFYSTERRELRRENKKEKIKINCLTPRGPKRLNSDASRSKNMTLNVQNMLNSKSMSRQRPKIITDDKQRSPEYL